MGLVKLPRIRDYWSSEQIFKIINFNAFMKRERYTMILSNIHFSAIAPTRDNKLSKVKDLIEISNNLFSKYYTPGPDIVIGESMLPFKGRLSWKQFIPSKRTRYGIKLFRLCAHNGYVLKNIIYTGKRDKSLEKFSTKVLVEELMEGYLN